MSRSLLSFFFPRWLHYFLSFIFHLFYLKPSGRRRLGPWTRTKRTWRWRGLTSQTVTKDLTSSSMFSGSCVLTLQTLPLRCSPFSLSSYLFYFLAAPILLFFFLFFISFAGSVWRDQINGFMRIVLPRIMGSSFAHEFIMFWSFARRTHYRWRRPWFAWVFRDQFLIVFRDQLKI